MTRILVCGGRDYGTRMTEDGHIVVNTLEVEKLNSTLNEIRNQYPDLIIIQGEARGADSLARDWAHKNKIVTLSFPANWKAYGKSAGYRRNVQMLEEGKPDIVVAFPGGKGTEMMCEIARTAGIPVLQINK